ncbi:glycosyltransferase [Nocardioides sp.]|uniref:glycosyltransferase n=1 Tax=Nocardioides sp. TaxID=35761 RepID=UPI003D0D4532
MDNHVRFIAVSYFGSADAAALVESLMGQWDPRWTLVLVDNSQSPSELAALEVLASMDQRVQVLDSRGNLGYYGGASAALRLLPASPRWTCVCNVDLTVANDAVGEVLRDSESSIGVLAPGIWSQKTGHDQNPYMRSRPSRRATFLRYWMFRWTPVARILVAASALKGGLRVRPRLALDTSSDIYAPHGACIFFSTRYFQAGGDFEHPVFLFGEEITVAENCARLGLKVGYRPQVRVYHNEHRATGTWRSKNVLNAQREAARFLRAVLGGPRRGGSGC